MSLPDYLHRFASLSRAPLPAEETLGKYPHKPILLLSILDLIAGGYFRQNRFFYCPELNDLFADYWRIALPFEPIGNIGTPWKHLEKEGFWSWTDEPQPLSPGARIARFDDELFELSSANESRTALQLTLIESNFAPSLHELLSEKSATTSSGLYEASLILEAHQETIRETPPPVRSSTFRYAVTRAYDYRCAICGVRIFDEMGRSVVEAAHIIPWSKTHDDNPQNGLCLCRLCHWTFDAGMLGVSDDYTVTASSRLTAGENLGGILTTVSHRQLILPSQERLWPSADNLRWHHAHVYRR